MQVLSFKNFQLECKFLIYFLVMVVFLNIKIVLVMVEGPAVGKAGNFLDWIAGGLEMNGVKDFGNPCPL